MPKSFKRNSDIRQRPDKSELCNVEETNEKLITNSVQESKNSRVISLIFLSLLLDLLAFTMILPLLPSLLDYYNKKEENGKTFYTLLLNAVKSFQNVTGAPDRFVSVLFGGALGSMYCFLQFLTSPIIGSLSDAYGRKPMLLICLTGVAISHAIWSYARSFGLFVLARVVGGLSKANVSLSMAIVADASNEKTRAKGMALIGLAFSIGFIVGPLAGAWFALSNEVSPNLWGEKPALYAFSLSVINIAVVLFFVEETLAKEKRSPLSMSLTKAIDYVSPWHLLRFTSLKELSVHQNNVLCKLGLIYFIYLFIYSGLEFTITFLTHHVFGYTAMQQGKMFLVIGAIMAVLQGGAARKLQARGAEMAATGALILTPLSFICIAFASAEVPPLLSPVSWLWAGLVLFAISTAFAVSCLSSLAAAAAPARARGAALGTLRSLGALARAAGPLLACAVYWCYGASVTYTLGSAILVLPAVMIIRLKT